MNRLMDALFNLTLQVRYVAVYSHGELSLRQRPDLSLASAPESDRYEELLVNPTVLTLTQQRGDIATATSFSSSCPSKAATCRWRSSLMLTPSLMLRRSCT
jgi:hypothetical protein